MPPAYRKVSRSRGAFYAGKMAARGQGRTCCRAADYIVLSRCYGACRRLCQSVCSAGRRGRCCQLGDQVCGGLSDVRRVLHGERALFKGMAAGTLAAVFAMLLFAAIGGGFRVNALFLVELIVCAVLGALGALVGVKLRRE